jgi:hypothetical protein
MARGDQLLHPMWPDVSQCIDFVAEAGQGIIELNALDADEDGPQMLQAHVGWGLFDIGLGEFVESAYRVRTLNPVYAVIPRGMPITDFFPTNSLSADFDLMRRLLREFFETGNVSGDLLV